MRRIKRELSLVFGYRQLESSGRAELDTSSCQVIGIEVAPQVCRREPDVVIRLKTAVRFSERGSEEP